MRRAVPDAMHAPRQRLPAPSDELASRLQSMSISPSRSAEDVEMAQAPDSDSDSDDLDIVATDPRPLDHGERLQAIARGVAGIASPEGVRTLQDVADRRQAIARDREQHLPAAPFSELLVPNPHNFRSHFGPLRQAVVGFADAAHAWQDAAIHHATAAAAADRFGLGEVHTSASQAAAECEARATRLHVQGEALRALCYGRLSRHEVEQGNFRALEVTTDVLRGALDRIRADGLHSVPIEGFDRELQYLARQAHTLLQGANGPAGPERSLVPTIFPARVTASDKAWQHHFTFIAAGLTLVDTIDALRQAMRAETPAAAAPSSSALLKAALETTTRATRTDQIGGDPEALGAWLDTAEAFGHLSQVLADVSARVHAGGPETPTTQALRQRIAQDLEQTAVQVRSVVERAADNLWRELPAVNASPTDNHLETLRVVAANLARRSGELQARVAGSAVLERLARPGASPSDLAQPLAALQQASVAIGRAAAGFDLHAAEALAEATSMARSVAAIPGIPAARLMADVASFCQQARQDVLSVVAEGGHQAACDFMDQTWQESMAASARLQNAMLGLHGLLVGDPLPAAGTQATLVSPQPAPDADRSLIQHMLTITRAAEARRANAVVLPADAPPLALTTQRISQMVLQAAFVSAHAIAESLSTYNEALSKLPQVPLKQRAKTAQALVERLRVADARVAETLAEQIDFKDGDLPEHLAQTVKEQGAQLRHTERLTERLRMPLQALGLVFEAQLGAQAYRSKSRTLDPMRCFKEIKLVGTQYNEAAMLLKTSALRLLSKLLEEKTGNPDFLTSIQVELENVSTQQALKDLTFRVTIERELVHGRLMVDLLQRNLATPQHLRTVDGSRLKVVAHQARQHVKSSNDEIQEFHRESQEKDIARALLGVGMGLLRELQTCDEQVTALIQQQQAGPSGAAAGTSRHQDAQRPRRR